MKDHYYVYALLDARRPGTYQYEDLMFDYEPFYIGKGSNDRMYAHVSVVKKQGIDCNIVKSRKINAILKEGLNVKYKKLYQYQPEDRALSLEIDVTKKIGRLNIKTGPLTNLTEGGEKRIITDEIRKRISKGVKADWKKKKENGYEMSEDHKNNIGKNIKKHWQTEEYRVKQKNNPAFSGHTHTDETKKKMSKAHNGLKHSEESKKKISQANKGKPKSKEHRQKIKESWTRRKQRALQKQ